MAVFFNQATLTYEGGSASSNIVTGELLQVLSVSKTSLGTTYERGEDVVYAISVVNSGAGAVSGLTVTDDLGAYTVGAVTAVPLDYVDGSAVLYVNGVLQAAPTVTAGPPLIVSGLSIPAGGNALILYRATPNDRAPLGDGGAITNTASVSGGGQTGPVSDSNTVTADVSPRLTISKSISPTTVVENGTVTYTFVIENTGSTAAVATDNLVVTDTFDPILSNITVSLDGVALSEPDDYTYNETTGEFATVTSRITVPAATYTQDPATGVVTVVPGVTVLRISGTV